MNRAFRCALAALVAAAPALAGCGDSGASGAVERSAEAVQADTRGQDAMREFMQSKRKKPAKAARSEKAAPSGKEAVAPKP